MILTGIGDEAGANIDAQIKATKELGWKHLEMRFAEVPGFPKGNFHDIPDEAFNICVEKLQANGIGVYAFGSAHRQLGQDRGDAVGRYGGRSEALHPAHAKARHEIRAHHEFQAEG